MKMWEAVKRALTLPKRWNSVADVGRDPTGAIDHVCEVLRNVQFVLTVLGNVRAYDKTGTAIQILQEVKRCLHDRQ